ncbi:DoxX family protein [Paraflavitalea sp. CAU 1676]|uniref:DoxX family protein n=1 Tax=Paraflavitalea sp. CAU 1676 TaxID=3032598 RepID=UPI0023DAA9CE|nr:DoxX family protein [Paraflavitalea sp. CAU 1676]MDF2189510.1 DoxX family protein [Paraflavitalea sp. CAU 1676]
MRNRILATTDSYSWFILRVALGFVMLGHGVQKAFGWFGGYGWDNTIGYFTGTVGMPSWMGALVILIESLGALLLIVGFAGRINAALTGIVMIGAFFVDHLPNGFFMNWFGTNKGEGYEFDILLWAIALVITINGSGRCSIDRWLTARKPAGARSSSIPTPAV